MKVSRTIFGAFVNYFTEKFNLRCVRVKGGFVVAEVCCETCCHKLTNHRPLCPVPSSVGCDDWEFGK